MIGFPRVSVIPQPVDDGSGRPGWSRPGRYPLPNSPPAITLAWPRGAVGSASDWQSEGQGFESPRVHQLPCFAYRRSAQRGLASCMSAQCDPMTVRRFGLHRGDCTVNTSADAPYSARVDRLKLSDHPDRRFACAVDFDFLPDLGLVEVLFTGFWLQMSGVAALLGSGGARSGLFRRFVPGD